MPKTVWYRKDFIVERYQVIIWVVCAFIIGACLSWSLGRIGYDCNTYENLSGPNFTEVCSRQVMGQ